MLDSLMQAMTTAGQKGAHSVSKGGGGRTHDSSQSQARGLCLLLHGMRGGLAFLQPPPVAPHVHEEESHGGERGGVDGEGAQQRGGEPAREHAPALLLPALPHAVRDAAVLVDAAHAIGLEAGLDDVHRVGGDPGGDARHAAGKEELGDHVRVFGLAAQGARQHVIGQEVDAEAGRLADEGGHHAAVDAPHPLLVVDAYQAVQGILVQLLLRLLLARALHLHACLGQLHGTADDTLDGPSRCPRQELIERRVPAQRPQGIALDAKHDGVDER